MENSKNSGRDEKPGAMKTRPANGCVRSVYDDETKEKQKIKKLN
jgi:hypothetical protein